MKTKTIAILIILATATLSLTAQTVSEKTVKGTTYIITQNKNSIRKKVKNKNGLFDKYYKEINFSCPAYITKPNSTEFYKEMLQKIFTKERIKELASTPNTNILIQTICSRSGDVVAIDFEYVNTDVITWDEIKALEDAYLQIKYVLDASKCPDVKYYLLMNPINFSKF